MIEFLTILCLILFVVLSIYIFGYYSVKNDLDFTQKSLVKTIDDCHKYAKQSWDSDDKVIVLTVEKLKLKNKLDEIVTIATS